MNENIKKKVYDRMGRLNEHRTEWSEKATEKKMQSSIDMIERRLEYLKGYLEQYKSKEEKKYNEVHSFLRELTTIAGNFEIEALAKGAAELEYYEGQDRAMFSVLTMLEEEEMGGEK